MSGYLQLYIIGWSLACLLALMLVLRNRTTLALFQWEYWRWLLQPWKLSTFLIAATGMTLMAPYTGDPTWDYVDAAFMSVLAYGTAPWAAGIIYQTIRGQRAFWELYIALCIWLFSASWSYDLYLLWRDGYYPITWLANLFASSVLYCCAGLFWNLEYRQDRGVIFGFMATPWPRMDASRPSKLKPIIWYALPFMILVSAMILPFLL